MQKPPRSRMFIFLLLAVIVAGGMQVIDGMLSDSQQSQSVTKANVSKGDIRRAVSLPLDVGIDLLEKNISFISLFGDHHINLLVLDIPLHVRAGAPSYLEYNRFGFNQINNFIETAHNAGLETALNPVITGQIDILDDPHTFGSVYMMYDEWCLMAAATKSDALYINPPGLLEHSAGSDVLESIEKLYESYTGELFMHTNNSSLQVMRLYQNHVRGFIAHLPNEGAVGDFIAAVAGERESGQVIFAANGTSALNQSFGPYVKSSDTVFSTDLNTLFQVLDGVERLDYFHGVILPGSLIGGTAAESIAYSDELSVWFEYLKKVSQKRAFVLPSGQLR